jgi:hypothetical protein
MNIRTFISKIVTVIFFLTSQGCVFYQAKQIDKELNSLVGQPIAAVVARFGLPTSRFPDGNGGEVWIYEGSTSYSSPGYSNTTSNALVNSYGTASYNRYSTNYTGTAYGSGNSSTFYIPPSHGSYKTIRSFYVSKNGFVTGYQWKGV